MAALLFTAWTMAGCSNDESSLPESLGQAPGKLKAVTSLALLADFAQEIGKDSVEVTSLLSAGADPHTFEATPKDVKNLKDADIVFINGLGLEANIEPLIRNNVPAGTPVVRLAELIEGGGPNPHLWLNIPNAKAYALNISQALARIHHQSDPYVQNYLRYSRALSELEAEMQKLLGRIPPERRKLVTLHDAFPELAKAYGLEIVGTLLTSPGSDPSPQHLANLLSTIRQLRIPAIFVEPQFNSNLIKRLAEDAGTQVCTLYSDTLDNRVRTYLELMRFNASELVRCLS